MVYNYFLSVVTILFSCFFLIFAFQLPEGRSGSTTLAPGDWPVFVLSFMLVMGFVLLVKTVKKHKSAKDEASLPKDETSSDEEQSEPLEKEPVYKYKQWMILGAFVIYTYLMGFIGFTLATLFFVFTATIIFGLKRKVYSFLTAILGTTAFVILFGVLLNIPLPRGVAFFRELSFLLY